VPPEGTSALDAALERLESFDWVVFTSANGVDWFVRRLLETGRDVRAMWGPKLAAIGPKTAEALQNLRLKVDYVPSEFVAEAVVREFPEDVRGKKILIPRAAQAREVLPESLRKLGADVEVVAVYETVLDASDASSIREMLAAGQIHAVTFTSSSTVKNFVELVRNGGSPEASEATGRLLPENVIVACIGPITADTARSLGLEPDVVSNEYTIDGLVAALLDYETKKAR